MSFSQFQQGMQQQQQMQQLQFLQAQGGASPFSQQIPQMMFHLGLQQQQVQGAPPQVQGAPQPGPPPPYNLRPLHSVQQQGSVRPLVAPVTQTSFPTPSTSTSTSNCSPLSTNSYGAAATSPPRRPGPYNYPPAPQARHDINKQLEKIDVSSLVPDPEGYAVPGVGANGVLINIILDESGSMASVTDATITNFNNYLNDQRKLHVQSEAVVPEILDAVVAAQMETAPAAAPSAGSVATPDANTTVNSADENKTTSFSSDCFVSLVKFDAPHVYAVYERKLLGEAPALSRENYCPNGGTNLYDAIGASIIRTDAYLKSVSSDAVQRPSVLVVIITDGEENQSQRFNSDTIKKMISARQAAGWTFVFLGANIDAWKSAASVGIAQSHAFNFDVRQQASMSSALSSSTARWRGQQQTRAEVLSKAPPSSVSVMNSAWSAQQVCQQYFEPTERRLETPQSVPILGRGPQASPAFLHTPAQTVPSFLPPAQAAPFLVNPVQVAPSFFNPLLASGPALASQAIPQSIHSSPIPPVPSAHKHQY